MINGWHGMGLGPRELFFFLFCCCFFVCVAFLVFCWRVFFCLRCFFVVIVSSMLNLLGIMVDSVVFFPGFLLLCKLLLG